MITIPITAAIFACIVYVLIGLLIGAKIMKSRQPSIEEQLLQMAKIYSMGAETREKEAIARGYGEMYDKEISPDKHPGLTIPSFRWINPEGFVEETKENER